MEGVQAITAQESPRTTKFYDRTANDITLDDIERIGMQGRCFLQGCIVSYKAESSLRSPALTSLMYLFLPPAI